ncbi:Retrovirus-related Pol polyprotein from transposon 17.6, partial [Mucuna pruriens]
MHRILLEEARPVRQSQRRLNPTILDVIKKEVMKLLSTGIIYPISSNYFREAGRYMQIHIASTEQHKTTFTYLFGTFAYTRMSFSLFNALRTFQRELDEGLYGRFYDNLVLNFEKCHFMVTKGIVLRHLVSNRGIEVDKAKIDIIASLSHPAFMREVRSFLGHANFYRRFIQNFSKIAFSLSKLLQQNVEFAPDWELPFKLICDASSLALGVVLGQQVGKHSHVIAYASRTLDSTQANYTTTKKEPLAIVFALDKFRSYLLGSKIVVFSDHVALKFLLKKPDAKPRLICWMFLLQEFDIEIRDKSGAENLVADRLSRIERSIDPLPIRDDFPHEQLIDQVGIMGHTGQLGKYWIVGFIGLPFLRMSITSLPPTSNAKELE